MTAVTHDRVFGQGSPFRRQAPNGSVNTFATFAEIPLTPEGKTMKENPRGS